MSLMSKSLSLVVAMTIAACGRSAERHAPYVEGRHPLVVSPKPPPKPPIPPLAPLAVTSVETDPFWQLEREGFEAYGYGLADLTRTASPIVADGVVYAHGRGGTYVDCATADPADDCGPAFWDTIVHQVRAYAGGIGSPLWTHDSSWKPQPGIYGLAGGFEPLFQFALSGDRIFVPSSNGRVEIISRATGATITTSASPLDGGAGDSDTYVTSPITVAPDGAGWYTVMALSTSSAVQTRDSWVVRMDATGAITSRSFGSIVTQPMNCIWSYDYTTYLPIPYVTPLPWPPAGGVIGPTFGCGPTIPATNAAPAIAVDGASVIVLARASRSDYAWLVRLDEGDMSTMQQISLRDLLNDDCGVATPSTATTPTANACRVGTALGVDRTTGVRPGARAVHTSTSSPVALHDGGIAIGTYSPYRNEQGHLLRFGSDGAFMWASSFGWLVNPLEVERAGVGGPSYELVVDHSIYDDGPFWMQGIDSLTGARNWSYSEGFAGAGTQCLAKPGGKTTCLPVAGGGSYDFVVRRPARDAAGNIWTITSGGDVQQLSPSGVLLSSTHIAGGGDRMLDAPIVIDGAKVRVAYRGQLFTLTP